MLTTSISSSPNPYPTSQSPISSMMQEQSVNLGQLCENAMSDESGYDTYGLQVISQLKFRNIVYQPGDDVVLDYPQEEYGKVLTIIRLRKELQDFPLLRVAWYYSRTNPALHSQRLTHLAKKELVLTDHTDWQYMETLKGKIQVVNEERFTAMTPYERAEKRTFLCRSHMALRDGCVRPIPRRVCHCLAPFNPDEMLIPCALCGVVFHPNCSGNHELCIMCH